MLRLVVEPLQVVVTLSDSSTSCILSIWPFLVFVFELGVVKLGLGSQEVSITTSTRIPPICSDVRGCGSSESYLTDSSSESFACVLFAVITVVVPYRWLKRGLVLDL